MLYLSYAANRYTSAGNGEDYYVLAGEEVPRSEVVIIHPEWQPGVDVVVHPASDESHEFKMADSDPQYLGTTYLDVIARVQYNLGDWTQSEIATLFRAIWKDANGDWVSGTAADWEAAGKLQPMRFTPGTTIQGVENEQDNP